MKIIIDSGMRWSYFQWFMLGFYELEKRGLVDLSINIPWHDKIRYFIPNNFLVRVIEKLFPKVDNDDNFNLRGRIIDNSGCIYKFCIDPLDSPYIYDEKDLKNVDLYFKMQCPKNFDVEGFKLSDGLIIPWTNVKYSYENNNVREPIINFSQYVDKIKPLMVGPRRLAFSNTYKCLKEGYNNQIKYANICKKGLLMCYFGNAKGPIPKIVDNDEIDVNKEDQILGKYSEIINHPNEKRGIAAQYIADLRDKAVDARVVNAGNSDTNINLNESKYIPYENFAKHVSNFCYNLNISGYRLSIPNRFIESFMVGTAILTDKLSVRWYREFSNDEVKETVAMGYLPTGRVDWQGFKQDLENLVPPSNERTLSAFYKKWSPDIVAQYIINTVLNQ